ncbi:MAG TPA: hypothetical protein VIF60_03900 [Burkholderiaceae bacterium]
MSTDIRFHIDKPELQTLLDLLGNCGEVVSIFLKPKPAVAPSFSSIDDPIGQLLELDGFSRYCEGLGSISRQVGRFAILNRLEFEGSITSVILQGGCHHSTYGLSKSSASAVVADALDRVFPEPFSDLYVCRIDNESWCSLTNDATLSSTYVAYQIARGLWWILCVAGFD